MKIYWIDYGGNCSYCGLTRACSLSVDLYLAETTEQAILEFYRDAQRFVEGTLFEGCTRFDVYELPLKKVGKINIIFEKKRWKTSKRYTTEEFKLICEKGC